MGDGENLKPAQFPALQISDLLVLTLSIAVAMACAAPGIQDVLTASESASGLGKWNEVARELTDFSAIGLSLFGLIVLARQRIRGTISRLEPGHSLLIAAGPYCIALLFVIAYQRFDRPSFLQIWPDLALAVALGVSVVFSIDGLRRLEWTWKISLLAVVVWLLSCIGFCIWDAGRTLGYWEAPVSFRYTILIGTNALTVAGLAVIAAVVVDARRRVSRDWLHFCGVAIVLCNVASYEISFGPSTARWWRGLALWMLS
jgi:hypothetical protein